jgi:hypothetical protein
VPRILSSYDLTAPELPGPADAEIMQFFRWLRSYLDMVESGSRLHEDLCATGAARTLAASVCGLLPGDTSSLASITKAHLRHLRKRTFEWPSEEDVLPERLSPLPRILPRILLKLSTRRRGLPLCIAKGFSRRSRYLTCPSSPVEF